MSHAERRRESLEMLAEWMTELVNSETNRLCGCFFAAVLIFFCYRFFAKSEEAEQRRFNNERDFVPPELNRTVRYPSESCPICLCTLAMLIQTNCGHTFCWTCLEEYWILEGEPSYGIRCPLCRRRVTSLSVAHLETYYEDINNFHAEHWNVYNFVDLYNGILNPNASLYSRRSEHTPCICKFFKSLFATRVINYHILTDVLLGLVYLFLPDDFISERVHGIYIGFIDDIAVLALLTMHVLSIKYSSRRI